jgi:hypothetical protein
MDEDVKAKLTAAWRAAVARLMEAGYDRADVYETMISVALAVLWIEAPLTQCLRDCRNWQRQPLRRKRCCCLGFHYQALDRDLFLAP